MGKSFDNKMSQKTLICCSLLLFVTSPIMGNHINVESENDYGFEDQGFNEQMIKKISENEFEWRIEEHGTNFTQRIILDEENGFVISHVPAHHDRMETTFYNDETNGLMLAVTKSQKTVFISRAFISQTVAQQKAVYESMAQQKTSDDRLVVTPEKVNPPVELIDITDPDTVDSECLPEKYKSLIPEGYSIHLVHQVHKFERKNTFHNKDDPTKITVYDPLTQRNYTVGDDVDEVFKHVFDNILPPVEGTDCPQSFTKKRAKRATTCYDENMRQVTTRCGRVIQGRCSTCSARNVGYDCRNGGSKCIWTILCSKINHKDCIDHIVTTGTISCDPCCLVRGCDGNEIKSGSGSSARRIMGTCQGLPEDEICPQAGTGCPHAHVRTIYTGLMKKESCFVDYQRCTSVYDSRGDLRNTGVNCNPVPTEIPHSTFCCDSNDESINHNLPSCS